MVGPEEDDEVYDCNKAKNEGEGGTSFNYLEILLPSGTYHYGVP